MDLLILKSGQQYIRCKDNAYLPVSLEKASVFPPDQLDVVQRHECRLKEEGFEDVCIKKLVLSEEEL